MTSRLRECIEDWVATSGGGVEHPLDRATESTIGNLSEGDICEYLKARDDEQRHLFSFASYVRDRHLGRRVLLRAVVEISNICRVDCTYCEMRVSNRSLADQRFRLSKEEILAVGQAVSASEIDTLLLQGGEDVQAARGLLEVLPELKKSGLTLILCLGSLDRKLYEDLKSVGADAYIIKYETSEPGLHQALTGRPLQKRLECIDWLVEAGYRVGSGLISGLPGPGLGQEETERIICADILLAQRRQFSMCSVSPFVPEEDTPLRDEVCGDLDTALNALALLRIANPLAHIPSVSAFEQHAAGGQARGLEAGANVLTVNCSPPAHRDAYRIYGGKRFIVTREHAESIAREGGMEIVRGASIGIPTIAVALRSTWFDGRYSAELGLGDSVYGPPTPTLCQTVIWAGARRERVLDLGSGDGRAAIPMALAGASVHAVDSSVEAIGRLQRRSAHFGFSPKSLEVVQSDLCRHPTAEGSFGAVILANVLYYFDEKCVRSILSRAWHALSPGGRLYISLEICPRLRVADDGAGAYFRLTGQQNYSGSDLLRFLEGLPGCELHSMEAGDVVNRRFPLPRNALKEAPSAKEYLRTYSPFEVVVTKESSS